MSTLVAIVSYNSRDDLAAGLGALEGLPRDRYSVAVVDNGSSDGSRELVKGSFPWVSLIEPDENLGYGRAVNLAARGKEPQWLIAANADVIARPDAIERLVSSAAEDPEVGIVAPTFVSPGGAPQQSAFVFPRISSALVAALGLHRVFSWFEERGRRGLPPWPPWRRQIDYPLGALLVIRGALFRALGGFPGDVWMYGEDMDLSWRAQDLGWKVVTSDVEVIHRGGASTLQIFSDREIEGAKALEGYRWLAKRRGAVYATAFCAVNVAGHLLRAAGRAVIGRLGSPSGAVSEAKVHLGAYRAALLSSSRAGRPPTAPAPRRRRPSRDWR